jgi:hypothetical protein
MNEAQLRELLAQVKEIEELMRFPSVSGHLARASSLAMSIARNAPTGAVVNLAMQVISESNALRPPALPLRAHDGRLGELLRRLRAELEQAVSAEELVRQPRR